jgi:NAD(P)-dependent dehydrogenase (short-subunit alcohol dehydrogenase family)
VILAVRNQQAGEEAKRSIELSTKSSEICEVWQLDLASYDSVISFARRAAELPRLDVVVANASITTPRFELLNGHERTITVNVIGTMLLNVLLLPILRQSARSHPGTKPRLTTVVSEAHDWTKFPERNSKNIFAALDSKELANMEERYNTSKLLQILLFREMVLKAADDSVVINMVNPRFCRSNIAREHDLGIIFAIVQKLLARTTEVGGRTLVAGATGGDESHGAYMMDAKVHNGALSVFIRSGEGKKVQTKLWQELVEILEKTAPGSTKVL